MFRYPVWGSTGVGGGGYATWNDWLINRLLPGTDFDYVTEAGDIWKNAIVSSALRFLMSTFPEPALVVKRTIDDPDKEDPNGVTEIDVRDHPLLELLEYPNEDGDDSTALEQAFALDFNLWGAHYWLRIRNTAGRVVGLQPIPYKMMAPVADPRGIRRVGAYVYFLEGKRVYYKPEDVVHFRFGRDPHNVRNGFQPLTGACRDICTENELATLAASVARNMGISPYVISPMSTDEEAIIPKEQATALEERFDGKTRERRGLVTVLKRAMRVDRIGFSPDELMADKARDTACTRILGPLGLDPMVIGMPSPSKTFCLPADARVWAVAGAKAICDVQVGDSVWSFDNGMLRPSTVLRSGKTGHKTLYEIRTKNRILRASGNHPILTRVAGRMGGCANEERSASYEWKRVDELTIKDRIVQAKFLPDQEGTLLPTQNEATPEMMQFLGAMIGDGTVFRKGGRIIMSMPPADRCVEHYAAMASVLFQKNSGESVLVKQRPRSFEFCGTQTCDSLNQLGVGGRAKTKRVPGWVYGMARHLRLSFIAGLVDTDGSIDKRGVLQFGFCNKELTHDIRDLLISCGIQCNNIRYQQISESSLPQRGTSDNYDSWAFVASSAKQVAQIPFADPLYRQRVQNNVARFKSDGFDAKQAGLQSELGFYTIKSIRELPPEDVYDIEVEGTHSFIADGIVVHNSNYKEALDSAAQHNLIPVGDMFCTRLTREFRYNAITQQGEPGYLQPNERLAWDYSKVGWMQERQEVKRNTWRENYKVGVATRYEAKVALGLPADKTRDDVYIQDITPVRGAAGDIELTEQGKGPASAVSKKMLDQLAEMWDA